MQTWYMYSIYQFTSWFIVETSDYGEIINFQGDIISTNRYFKIMPVV